MRNPYLIFLFLCALATGYSTPAIAQIPEDYFQQQVNYVMTANLKPESNSVEVVGNFTYINNSPNALDTIPIHLWANAFASRNSDYAKQKRRHQSAKFAFAPDAELGGYQNLVFKGHQLKNVVTRNLELQTLQLSSSLVPGDSILVEFSYTLKIPKAFSRLGRDEEIFQLTQWFPKPAVYDKKGWNVYSYLDLGEFYYEFGNYDVTINVPTNGIVAATGKLINSPAIALHAERIALSDSDTARIDALQYEEGTVSFRYIATSVHDFAWFASPNFRINEASARLSKQAIPAYVYYTKSSEPEWKGAAEKIARAAVFADSLVGTYPHPKIAAVSAPIGVGGGMEYPMITVIGAIGDEKELDLVLAHEAFHNWFQGMAASNERLYPWMDEGMTSWLEGRYMKRYYGESSSLEDVLPKFLAKGQSYNTNGALHRFYGIAKRNPKPNEAIDSLSPLGYGYAAYTQPQLIYDLLESFQGQKTFDSNIRAYFANWSMRHPQPIDLQNALGGAEVAWAFNDFIFDNKVPDYAITFVKTTDEELALVITNKAGVKSPVSIAVQYPDGSYGNEQWIAGFSESDTIKIKRPKEAVRVALDPFARTPEINRKDNYYRLSSGPGPRLEPLAVNLITHFGHPDRNDLNVVPTFGYNASDQVMLGIGFHNYTLAPPATRFYLLPMISTRDASLNGMAGIRHSIYRKNGALKEVEFYGLGRQFHYNYNENYEYNDRFHRATVGASAYFDGSIAKRITHQIDVQGIFIAQRYARGLDITSRSFREEKLNYQIAEANYALKREDPINPFTFGAQVQAGSGFARISGSLNFALRYQQKANFIRLRAFAGSFLTRALPEFRAVLLPNGVSGFLNSQYDYTFEQFLVNRSTTGSNQVYVRDGSLTLPFLLSVPFSDSWLTSLSIVGDAPFSNQVLRFQGYVDMAVYPDTRTNATGVVAPLTGGLRIGIFGDFVQVSFPLINSAFVKESLAFTAVDAKYTERIAFSINLANANPDELIRKFRR